MLTATAPVTGANFQRLDLNTVVAGLHELANDAAKHGCLSPEQADWFKRYVEAWDYYRPSQPRLYQVKVEDAIGVIFAHHTDSDVSR